MILNTLMRLRDFSIQRYLSKDKQRLALFSIEKGHLKQPQFKECKLLSREMDLRSNFAAATEDRAKILKQYVRVIHNKDYCISFAKVKGRVALSEKFKPILT